MDNAKFEKLADELAVARHNKAVTRRDILKVMADTENNPAVKDALEYAVYLIEDRHSLVKYDTPEKQIRKFQFDMGV